MADARVGRIDVVGDQDLNSRMRLTKHEADGDAHSGPSLSGPSLASDEQSRFLLVGQLVSAQQRQPFIDIDDLPDGRGPSERHGLDGERAEGPDA
jgi:hypothetical protein